MKNTEKKITPFAHLHLHTEYSKLDGGCRIDFLPERVRELGMNAVGISDHGTMAGIPDFYLKMKAEGIKPIIGCEIYVCDDRTVKDRERKYWHLGLIAETTEGYNNLCKITSKAFLEGYYYNPRADWEVLRNHSEGIIALTGCMAAPVMNSIFRGDLVAAAKYFDILIDIFGAKNVYAEIQNVGIIEHIPADSELAKKLKKPVLQEKNDLGQVVREYCELSQTEANRELAELAAPRNVKLVATGDVHYIRDEDAEPHDAMICIGTRQKVRGEERKFSLLPKKYYMRTYEEMLELLPEWPEALHNTMDIVDRCDAEIIFGLDMLPKFPIPEDFLQEGWDSKEASKQYLRHVAEQGMIERYGNDFGPVHRERLEFELGVIDDMGYNDYFLIVWDFFREARDRNIATGPGRGSAAGAIVAYVLGITQLCPIEHGLLFERFLNPDRKSMPDVDCDFSIYRREELIEYVREKYNTLAGTETAVTQIVTFGMFKAKGAMRDSARVLNYPISMGDKLSKLIPPKPVDISLSDALKASKQLRDTYDRDPAAKEIIDLSLWLEGKVRNEGIHAAGVVIWDKGLENAMPVQQLGRGKPITTSYEMKYVDKLGALKMDFLGLRNLDVIQRACEIIKHTEGIDIDPYKVPLDDVGTYEMLARGEAIGVFQFESEGMRGAMRLVQPTEFKDLVALVALYRPGPMAYIPSYANRKAEREAVNYLTPKLEEILEDTYGITIYQEQSMEIAKKVAGFSAGDADLLRKAIGKKLRDLMDSMKPQFVDGCAANGVSKDIALALWADNEKAADYSFNKSHAACYGYLSYVTAYLKHNYPHAYMAALISSVMSTKDKVPFYLQEARRLGLRVLPPDVNRSLTDFAVIEREDSQPGEDKYDILVGLVALKSVGEGVIKDIIRERDAKTGGGPFRSLLDLIRRMPQLNKKVLEQMVKGGVLDSTGASRKLMLEQIEPLLEQKRKERMAAEKAVKAKLVEYMTPEILAQTGDKKIPVEYKRAVETMAKAVHNAFDPSEVDLKAEAGTALEKELLRVLRSELRKEGTEGERAEEIIGRKLAETLEGRDSLADQLAHMAKPFITQLLIQEDAGETMQAALEEMTLAQAMVGEDFTHRERLELERLVLGVYVSGHPLDEYQDQWSRYISLGLGEINYSHLSHNRDDIRLVAGVVTQREDRTFGSGRTLTKVTLDDLTGSREIVFFGESLNDGSGDLLKEGEFVACHVLVQEDLFSQNNQEEESNDDVDDENKPVKLTGVMTRSWDPDEQRSGAVRIKVQAAKESPQLLTAIERVLSLHPGDTEVIYVREKDGAEKASRQTVQASHTLYRELRMLLGGRKWVQ